jgi:hypothetical protein
MKEMLKLAYKITWLGLTQVETRARTRVTANADKFDGRRKRDRPLSAKMEMRAEDEDERDHEDKKPLKRLRRN